MVPSRLFKSAHYIVFVCLFFLCLCTCLFESMLMFMLECMTTKETLGNSFINTEKKMTVEPNLGSFCQLL